MTAKCEKPADDDFKYYPSAVHIETGMVLEFKAIAWAELDPQNKTKKGFATGTEAKLWEKEFPLKDWCYGYDRAKLGKLFGIETTKPVLDREKVQAVITKTGKVPAGVDPALFPQPSKTKASSVATGGVTEADEAGGKAVKKGVAGRVRVQSTLVVSAVVVVLSAFLW